MLLNYKAPDIIAFTGQIRLFSIGYVFQEYSEYQSGQSLKRVALFDQSKSSAKGARSSCTDWYIVTYSGGQVIDEQYVGRTCSCEQTRQAYGGDCTGGGGGNAVASQPPTINELNCNQLRSWNNALPRTIDDFVSANANKTWDQIITQTPNDNWFSSSNGGPSVREIADPLVPGVVIDLRHLLVMGKAGGFLGSAYEDIQWYLGGTGGSGRDHQDYYSNDLGYSFFDNYGGGLNAHPEKIADYLKEFLNNPVYRIHYPVDLVKARCP